MTSASNPMITRCPKCGTAFRVTQNQLQTAKGAVRCGSCLNVFKAQEYLIAVKPKAAPTTTPLETTQSPVSDNTPSQAPRITQVNTNPSGIEHNQPAPAPKAEQTTPPSSLTLELKKPNFSTPQQVSVTTNKSPTTRSIIKPITLDDGEDILISDDMEEPSTGENKYQFDSFMDIDIKPTSDVSLFERKIRPEHNEIEHKETDESWAEMLLDEEESEIPKLGVARPKSDEELADEALIASHQAAPAPNSAAAASTKPAAPSLVFSLIGETENPQAAQPDEFIFSEELTQIPSNQGFKPATNATTETETEIDAEAETPQNDDNHKRQVKTQPKIRSYDGSRAALLMNIIPAPIEFTAKSMRRWYQRKLWASLSLIGLIALVAQVAWFKFETLSRIEPYRTAYLFACPYLGCELPTLIDTRQITTSNLVVREHPTATNALAVDVMIINGATFDQPFPDLVLVFSDIDDNLVASRRFTPKDYLGGELAGKDLMPQNQKVYITLDIVDPGSDAINYRIYIPKQ